MIPNRVPLRVERWRVELEFACRCYRLDYYALAAIMDRESLGGEALEPKGPTGTGDGGHGRGLMQIDDRFHSSFIEMKLWDGTDAWKAPAWNILYGAGLFAHGLELLEQDCPPAIAAYNAGLSRVRRVMGMMSPKTGDEEKIKILDSLTTGGNYVSDVLRRASEFAPIKVVELEG